VKNNAGPNGEDAVGTDTRQPFLPRTPEVFAHDGDGNLLADGRWSYQWDAENRLISMETIPAVAGAFPALRQRLEFAYDGYGRRVRKKVLNGAGASYALARDIRFLYDGWNLLAELDGLNGNAVIRTHVWGSDMSGTREDAGGVGGLLFTGASDANHAFAYDGGGNVVSLVNTTTGLVGATYEYGTFGEPLRAEGPAASDNPFRFSTKFADTENGLVYYGYRYYQLATGRWLSRDPISEKGGFNLYGMIGNDPVGFFDVSGLYRAAGHFYAVYAVAVARGYSADEAYQLAFYAQVPDQFAEYSAFEGVGRHAKDRVLHAEWLRKIQERLHSLHGQDVLKWRECLSKLIQTPDLFPAERGLLLHAFGDAYAHTRIDSQGSEVSYGWPYGHANTPYGGKGPDLPSLRPQLYAQYVSALFAALPAGKSPQNRLLLEQTRNSPNGLPSNPFAAETVQIERLIRASGYNRNYRPELGLNNENSPTGRDNLSIPSQQLVDDLLQKIKDVCCKK
jgi:RHS repeat-associated protein